MIEVYKILQEKYDPQLPNILVKHREAVPEANYTRGHSQKLYKRKHRLEVRKYNFTLRVVDPWNSLPENVVSAPSINSFERRLDKFWAQQDLKYDFKKCLKILHSNKAPNLEETPEELNDRDIVLEVH